MKRQKMSETPTRSVSEGNHTLDNPTRSSAVTKT